MPLDLTQKIIIGVVVSIIVVIVVAVVLAVVVFKPDSEVTPTVPEGFVGEYNIADAFTALPTSITFPEELKTDPKTVVALYDNELPLTTSNLSKTGFDIGETGLYAGTITQAGYDTTDYQVVFDEAFHVLLFFTTSNNDIVLQESTDDDYQIFANVTLPPSYTGVGFSNGSLKVIKLIDKRFLVVFNKTVGGPGVWAGLSADTTGTAWNSAVEIDSNAMAKINVNQLLDGTIVITSDVGRTLTSTDNANNWVYNGTPLTDVAELTTSANDPARSKFVATYHGTSQVGFVQSRSDGSIVIGDAQTFGDYAAAGASLQLGITQYLDKSYVAYTNNAGHLAVTVLNTFTQTVESTTELDDTTTFTTQTSPMVTISNYGPMVLAHIPDGKLGVYQWKSGTTWTNVEVRDIALTGASIGVGVGGAFGRMVVASRLETANGDVGVNYSWTPGFINYVVDLIEN